MKQNFGFFKLNAYLSLMHYAKIWSKTHPAFGLI